MDTKALCIFTTLLGHKAVVSRLVKALNLVPGLNPTYVFIDNDDYANYSVPLWARKSDAWQAQYVARQKAAPVLKESFDLLLVNAWELVVAFRHIASRMAAAAVLDAVPATFYAQLQQQALNNWKRRLSKYIHHWSFAIAAREFDFFLPKGSDCANSLQNDYGISSDRCFLTLAPQYLDRWKPNRRSYTPRGRLLFVANDFAKKGGDFLLRLYSQHLIERFTLTIASNDPTLAGRTLPSGVQWLRGKNRDELLEVYQENDVFVFPTQQDFTPEVVAEALSVGLPCVVADITGIRDLVHDGQNGFRIPFGAPPEVWAARLFALIDNPDELTRMSTCARRFAERSLSFDRYATLIRDVIGRLLHGPGRLAKTT